MRKFLMSAILALALFLSEGYAYATPVQIYDSDFNDLFSRLKLTCRLIDIDIWGTEYYTYQGARRCETHFGNRKSNIIRFRLNNDNSISRVLITTSSKYAEDNDDMAILAVILYEIGLSQSEIETLLNKLIDKIDRISWYATYFHDKSSVWCSKTRRYVTLDCEIDHSKVDFYLYADI